MADEERGKRKRGRRRGRGDAHRRTIEPRDEAPLATEPEAPVAAEETATPTPRSPRFRFGRGGDKAGPTPRRERERERAGGGATSATVSPMDFWRSGSPRAYRPAPERVQTGPRWLRRITNFYLPPWAPVVGIIVVVFGILGVLFLVRSATGAPRIGDHWHIPYQFFACGEKQPNAQPWESGVHTHADGIIHIHPFQTYEEGSGARLVKWFEYGRGKLTSSSIRIPGTTKEWKNGDTCPDGRAGELQVFVTHAGSGTEEQLRGRAIERYIPQDGDRIRFVFGPPEEIIRVEDRTVIPAENATREIQVSVTDDGTDAGTKFEPSSIEVNQGETVKIVLTNKSEKISHSFRVAGDDKKYDTADDFLVTPDGEDPKTTGGILAPGASGAAVIRLDVEGEVEFRDDTLQDKTGTIVVRQSEATPSPTPESDEAVDVEFDLSLKDNLFSQTEFSVKAGEKFRFNLTNEGPTFVHNMRIAGQDNEFDTDDDIVSDPISIRAPSGVEGENTGELAGQIDEEGTYAFRCDFHPTEMTGTLVVE